MKSKATPASVSDASNTQAPCVLVGVTGCIAAYKTCEIVRGLQKAGVRVKVVMTQHATEFVGPMTFRALTREPVAVSLFDEPGDPIHHISLAQECDAFLIAPCTANVVAKIAHGIADDLLTTTALATNAPLIVAPAMNVNMYENAITQENLAALSVRGIRIIEAGEGYLACGDVGRGRLAEVDSIVAVTLDAIGKKRDMTGMRIMVTAGPTVEPIDAVRYVSNHSSGKMGYALARAAVQRGAQVTLISGPVALDPPEGVQVTYVQTACDMLTAAESAFANADVAVFCAAVADMRPEHPTAHKLKKGTDEKALATIKLVKNPDILATCAEHKRAEQIVVGFAAETDDVVGHATEKREAKHADFIVANDVSEGGAFGADNNEVWLVSAAGTEKLPRMSKDCVANAIFDKVLAILDKR